MSTTAAPTGTAGPAACSAGDAVRQAPVSNANANVKPIAMEYRIGSLLDEMCPADPTVRFNTASS